MRLGIFAYADTAAVPWGGFFEVPFLGGDNYSPVQAVRYRRTLIKDITKNRPVRIGLLYLHWLKIRRCAELCRNEGSECKRSSW